MSRKRRKLPPRSRVFAGPPWRRTEWSEYMPPEPSGRVGIGAPDFSGYHSGATIPPNNDPAQHVSDIDLAEAGLLSRERAARQEADRRRSMLAPMYSKGPVQYIGGIEDKAVIQGLGKKL